MDSKILAKSKWVVGLLNNTLTEEISRAYGSSLVEDNEYYEALGRLFLTELQRIVDGNKKLEESLEFIDREFEYLGLSNKYGELSDTHNFFRQEVLALQKGIIGEEYSEAVYARYKNANEYIKVGVYYALLHYILENSLFENNYTESNLVHMQEINEFLTGKDGFAVLNNPYQIMMRNIIMTLNRKTSNE